MTEGTAPAATDSGPLDWLRRYWRLIAFVAIGFIPFLPSIRAMDSFLLADNALGFVPFVLPLSAWLFWRRARHSESPTRRDVTVDLFFIVPLTLAALFVLVLVPARLSWYFWLYRVDLLALPLFVMAVGFVFFGYQQVLRAWPAFVLLFLSWPYVVVRLQQELGGVFVDSTVRVADTVVRFLRLSYERDPAATETFISTHLPEGENFVLVIGQLCSGTATFVGFGLIALALVFMMEGPWGRRWRWAGLGLVLAFVLNQLRVVTLLVLAVTADERVAIDVVHPVLGLVLFAALIVLMLRLLGPFGLRLDAWPSGERGGAWESTGGGRTLRGLYAGAAGVALLVLVMDVQVQEYAFLGIGDGAPVVDVASAQRVLPEIEGWELTHLTEIAWTDLFGRQARGDIFEYEHPSGQFVTVQSVVTDSKTTLDRYALEQCIAFHGRTIEGRELVALGHGVTGIVLHDTFEGVPSSSIYWQIPVNVDGSVRHARVAIFADIEGPRRQVQELPVTTSFATRFGITLENAFDGEPALDGLRSQVDLELVELAAQIIDTLVTTGGPANTIEAGSDVAAGGDDAG